MECFIVIFNAGAETSLGRLPVRAKQTEKIKPICWSLSGSALGGSMVTLQLKTITQMFLCTLGAEVQYSKRVFANLESFVSAVGGL